MSSGGAVSNREVVLMIAGWEYDRIEGKRRAHQHEGDIEAGGDEGQLLLALGIRPEHDSKAGCNDDGNHDPDRVPCVVRHDIGADEIGCNQRSEGQKKLYRPTEQRNTTSAASQILVRLEGH